MKSSSTALTLKRPAAVVFDLDDTLYKEIDFVFSGFNAVADLVRSRAGAEIFAHLKEEFLAGRRRDLFQQTLDRFKIDSVSCAELISCYRDHRPRLVLPEASAEVLSRLAGAGIPLGLMTDGRSCTQRNKIEALGIAHYFSLIIVSEEFGSEKPDPRNYAVFEDHFKSAEIAYIADNLGKDFVTAKARGWKTVCLRGDDTNIHRQDFSIDCAYHPDVVLDSLSELHVTVVD